MRHPGFKTRHWRLIAAKLYGASYTPPPFKTITLKQLLDDRILTYADFIKRDIKMDVLIEHKITEKEKEIIKTSVNLVMKFQRIELDDETNFWVRIINNIPDIISVLNI